MATLIIGIILLAAIVIALRKIIKDRKNGGCGCGCSGECCGCHIKKDD